MIIVVLQLPLTLRAVAFIIPNAPWWKPNYNQMGLSWLSTVTSISQKILPSETIVVEAARSKDCFCLKGNILTCWFPFRLCLVQEHTDVRQPVMWTSELSEEHTCVKLPHPQLCLPYLLPSFPKIDAPHGYKPLLSSGVWITRQAATILAQISQWLAGPLPGFRLLCTEVSTIMPVFDMSSYRDRLLCWFSESCLFFSCCCCTGIREVGTSLRKL